MVRRAKLLHFWELTDIAKWLQSRGLVIKMWFKRISVTPNHSQLTKKCHSTQHTVRLYVWVKTWNEPFYFMATRYRKDFQESYCHDFELYHISSDVSILNINRRVEPQSNGPNFVSRCGAWTMANDNNLNELNKLALYAEVFWSKAKWSPWQQCWKPISLPFATHTKCVFWRSFVNDSNANARTQIHSLNGQMKDFPGFNK